MGVSLDGVPSPAISFEELNLETTDARRDWGQEAEVIDISPSNLDSSLCFFQPSVSHDVLCIEVKYRDGRLVSWKPNVEGLAGRAEAPQVCHEWGSTGYPRLPA